MIGTPSKLDPAAREESIMLLIALASDEESGDIEVSTTVEPCLQRLKNIR
jgi:hypothetical protein